MVNILPIEIPILNPNQIEPFSLWRCCDEPHIPSKQMHVRHCGEEVCILLDAPRCQHFVPLRASRYLKFGINRRGDVQFRRFRCFREVDSQTRPVAFNVPGAVVMHLHDDVRAFRQ